MKLTRKEAIAKYGIEIIEKVDCENCEPTSRVIYPAFEPEHDGMMEWATQSSYDVQAYYYTPIVSDPEEVETWEIDHYEDNE